VHRYRLGEDGSVSSKHTSSPILDPDGPRQGIVGTDGLAVGPDGRLFVAAYGQGHIAVLDQEGSVVERVRTGGALPTNCAFGPDDRLYVTECELGVLEVIDVI
jgi:sugar lactone lactonase YvrE